MKKMMTGAALALGVVGAPITALAGEVNGNGRPTQGPAHANSICTFSGRADGGEGEPSGPGAPPPELGPHPAGRAGRADRHRRVPRSGVQRAPQPAACRRRRTLTRSITRTRPTQ